DDTDIGIQVGGLGVFNRFTLDIWEKAFEASNTSNEVHQELNWLAKSNGILTSHEAKSIEALLLDSKPDGQILSVRGHIVDVKDLTTLVGERYLTGFVIDRACLKYKELSRHGENSLFLPTFCQDWTSGDDAEHLKNKVMQYTCKAPEDMAKIHWVMMPLHLAGSHWGLLVINIKLKLMYYDDGLHWKPPSNLGCITKKLIQSLYDISDGMNSQFDPSAWDFSLTISHFGMPSQPAGSGSCGMGVIMSVDSIVNGPLKTLSDFSWKFDDMHNHRCVLLKQFLEWKTQDCSSQDEL
ncbi:uncharacterized protein LOC116293905, partial [Actinia tenebrosa]|uniref:Uncharacterized protein LOC116293905 n=1 Tax=Actinia tenebrosa TaxID=6105 RepID=A0A6P8HX47_ACTTE